MVTVAYPGARRDADSVSDRRARGVIGGEPAWYRIGRAVLRNRKGVESRACWILCGGENGMMEDMFSVCDGHAGLAC